MTVSKVENVSVMLLLELETNLREVYTYYGSMGQHSVLKLVGALIPE